MNAVQIFLLLALVLTLVVLAVLWRVLWQATRPVAQSQEREQVLSHVAVYREQLAELERELAQGSLDQAGFDLSHQELTQRLLEDAPHANT
jgi:cytochrome c-type biogenesis protein CcmH